MLKWQTWLDLLLELRLELLLIHLLCEWRVWLVESDQILGGSYLRLGHRLLNLLGISLQWNPDDTLLLHVYIRLGLVILLIVLHWCLRLMHLSGCLVLLYWFRLLICGLIRNDCMLLPILLSILHLRDRNLYLLIHLRLREDLILIDLLLWDHWSCVHRHLAILKLANLGNLSLDMDLWFWLSVTLIRDFA